MPFREARAHRFEPERKRAGQGFDGRGRASKNVCGRRSAAARPAAGKDSHTPGASAHHDVFAPVACAPGSDPSANSDATGSDGNMFDNPAWADFFEWQFENRAILRAMSRPDRFDATRAKLRALGLPDAIPWAQVRPGQ